MSFKALSIHKHVTVIDEQPELAKALILIGIIVAGYCIGCLFGLFFYLTGMSPM